uniref:N-acetyltransferase MAK3 n=1 Tax=Mycena chlorophos TaxID=658473 RepID=A0ABQ0ME95_MYCCL|nr:N-acetyltransferase MAK3 [Mycena chlorophos]
MVGRDQNWGGQPNSVSFFSHDYEGILASTLIHSHALVAHALMSILYKQYSGEQDLPYIMHLVQSELSEPYVVYTFRYFLHQWPHLSFLAYPAEGADSDPIGVICAQGLAKTRDRYGCALLCSFSTASALVKNSLDAMKEDGVEEIVLETEFDNSAALSLYESLGFIREKRLYRFYLNGKDAFRLVLTVPPTNRESDSSSSSSGSSVSGPRGYRAIRVSQPRYDSDEEDVSSR